MTDAQIARLARGFCDCTLPKQEWTHGAHFATALWLILNRPEVVAERDMPGMIRRYNESVGGVNDDHGGYHETITLASLRMTRDLLAGLGTDATPAGAFAALIRSPLGNKDWPLAYWTPARLYSVEARRSWVEPDIAPLP
ncbi:hypothetical protein WG908_14905 [Sphingobium sp. AN641]|uniref:hypothetical protein n=1 Tax=Sphingobium sp. AN641 TaxID=3133443 RepID=UPI0030BB21B4